MADDPINDRREYDEPAELPCKHGQDRNECPECHHDEIMEDDRTLGITEKGVTVEIDDDVEW